jgi:hypothetical protein
MGGRRAFVRPFTIPRVDWLLKPEREEHEDTKGMKDCDSN